MYQEKYDTFSIENFSEKIHNPDSLICLDSGCGDYERLWITTSLRGMLSGKLTVKVLTEGVHSGLAGGIIPSTSSILIQQLQKITNHDFSVKLPELQAIIPSLRQKQIKDIAKMDDRVQWMQRAEVDLMARSPVLVWRNATRVRLIDAFRSVYEAPESELLPGEPLICDGIELPLKHRKKRLDLEARGLIKGAQVVYLGPGKRAGFSRLHVIGAEDPNLSAASIIKIEKPGEEEPFIPYAASMGAAFLHGAAVTIHKAQGSQWDSVQVFAPDIFSAARTGRNEASQPLWKRLAYVAITRAQSRLLWVVRNRLSKPSLPLSVDDLSHPVTLRENFDGPK